VPVTSRVNILLADEDALRRDGLAAVLSGTGNIDIVGAVADGQTALEQIRSLRPDVAVVDLNLPGVHGIELVRRVRSEALVTKVVVLAGTADDDVIREVMRAGGDAYVLKTGPARHLIDAISYVRDGGRYFSPQLRHDGLELPPNGPRSRRLQRVAGTLQQEFEETHIQVKLAERVSALEQNLSIQAGAMHDLRDYSQRTEDNLSRLIAGVDRLAQELPKRLAATEAETQGTRIAVPAKAALPKPARRRNSPNRSRMVTVLGLALGTMILVGIVIWAVRSRGGWKVPPAIGDAPFTETNKPSPPPAGADIKTKMLAARGFMESRDYGAAEVIYRQVVRNEPENIEALKALASALYRQDKIDESASVLGRIPVDEKPLN
jgi:DNA-binding NarL/FixJ family response regulator